MSSDSTVTAPTPRAASVAAQREPGRWILVLDFGSQFTQLIARRIRELRVYCEIHPFDLAPELIRQWRPAGIVLSGTWIARIPASCAPQMSSYRRSPT